MKDFFSLFLLSFIFASSPTSNYIYLKSLAHCKLLFVFSVEIRYSFSRHLAFVLCRNSESNFFYITLVCGENKECKERVPEHTNKRANV